MEKVHFCKCFVGMRGRSGGVSSAWWHVRTRYVILLYCETLLQVLLVIYCKNFYWISLFTILLLFYVFEVGKSKSATQSVLMILTLNELIQKNFQVFFLYPQKFHILPSLRTLPPIPVACFFHYSVCTVRL